MFRVLELRDGKVNLWEGTEHVGPPPDGTLRWIDLQGQDDAQLELLRERFDFHPLPIEDCSHLDQRPKLEEYRDCLFLVTQGFLVGLVEGIAEQVEETGIRVTRAILASPAARGQVVAMPARAAGAPGAANARGAFGSQTGTV